MRAGPINPDNIDAVSAILATSRKTFLLQSAEAILRAFYDIRDNCTRKKFVAALPVFVPDVSSPSQDCTPDCRA